MSQHLQAPLFFPRYLSPSVRPQSLLPFPPPAIHSSIEPHRSHWPFVHRHAIEEHLRDHAFPCSVSSLLLFDISLAGPLRYSCLFPDCFDTISLCLRLDPLVDPLSVHPLYSFIHTNDMSQPPSPKPRSRTARPVSIDFSQDLSESRLYNMLPSVVQSRLPRLPSLRKSVSTYTLRSSPPSPRSRSGTSSPETAYYGTVVVRDSRNDDMDDTTSLSLDTATTVSVSEDDDLAPPKKQLRRPNEPTEAKTGIAWRIAYQGTVIPSSHLHVSWSMMLTYIWR